MAVTAERCAPAASVSSFRVRFLSTAVYSLVLARGFSFSGLVNLLHYMGRQDGRYDLRTCVFSSVLSEQ